MTLAIGLAAAVLFGCGGWMLVTREERELLSVARSETLLLARSLQTAFENALRDRQLEDVSETLGALARIDPAVGIFVFDEGGNLLGASDGAQAPFECVRLQQSVTASADPLVEFAPANSPTVLRIALRLSEEARSTASCVVLEKSLAGVRDDLRATREFIVATVAVFVAAVACIAWSSARIYVSGPLREMVAGMKRVRSGNLRIEFGAPRNDEVGEAQREFIHLVRELDGARARAQQELDARRRMERGLEHADKLITLGQLSAVMAHEIGSPLQVLEGRARALARHAEDAEATRRTSALIVEQAERITRIVTQMLSITRRPAPMRAPVDAESLVSRVVELLELEARRRDVVIRVVRSASTRLSADADQLQQIVLNLLRNALDAAPRDSLIECRLGGDADELVIEVVDQGPGFDPAVRAHLGEAFFTTKASHGGSGLGLSVVRSILQEHGGRLEFVFEPGGARVRAHLPRGKDVEVA
jgi:signal transduction histidine kinase